MIDISKLDPKTAIADIRTDRAVFLDHVLGMGSLDRLGDALDYFENHQPKGKGHDEKHWKAFDNLQHSYFSMQRAPFFVWRDTALKVSGVPDRNTLIQPLLRTFDNEVARAKRMILTGKNKSERVKSDLVCWEEWISLAYVAAIKKWLRCDQSTMAAIAWASAPVHDVKSTDKKTYTAASFEELERRDFMFNGFLATARAKRREELSAIEALM